MEKLTSNIPLFYFIDATARSTVLDTAGCRNGRNMTFLSLTSHVAFVIIKIDNVA